MTPRLARRRRVAVALPCLLACVLVMPALAAGLDPASPWPMFHRNAAHTGRTANPIPDSPAVSWSAPLGETIEFSSAAIGPDGTLYIGTEEKDLWSVRRDGVPNWSYRTGGNIRYSTPAVGDDGTIYVGSADGMLYAIRADGTLKWAAPTGGPVKTSPALATDGTIYVGSDDGNLWAFWPSGAVRWTYVAGDTIRSSPALGEDGTIYFGCHNGWIYAVRPDGSLRWSGATGGPIKGGPAIGQGGTVVFGSEDGFLYCVHRWGELYWATYTGNNIRTTPSIGPTGKIYVGIGSRIAVYRDVGTLTWSYNTGDRVYSSPIVHVAQDDSTETAICGSDDGRLYAVRREGLVWSAPLGAPVRSSASIGAIGHVYVGAMDGRLYAIGVPYTAVEPEGVRPQTDIRLVVHPNPVIQGETSLLRLLGGESDAGWITIHDGSGRTVARVASHSGVAGWNGFAPEGRPVPAGVYLARWTDGRREAHGRLVLVR